MLHILCNCLLKENVELKFYPHRRPGSVHIAANSMEKCFNLAVGKLKTISSFFDVLIDYKVLNLSGIKLSNL